MYLQQIRFPVIGSWLFVPSGRRTAQSRCDVVPQRRLCHEIIAPRNQTSEPHKVDVHVAADFNREDVDALILFTLHCWAGLKTTMTRRPQAGTCKPSSFVIQQRFVANIFTKPANL